MTVGLSVLPVAVRKEDDIVEQPYLWSDLIARRTALGLQAEELAPVLRVDLTKYRSRETGALEVGPYLAEELIAMEEFVAATAAKLVASAPAAGSVALQAAVDQDGFLAAYQGARTLRDGAVYPVALQHVAVGRAAAELSRLDREVEVHRGDRRADLTVRRLAVGLGKNAAAELFGVNKKTYYNAERGTRPPLAGSLAELQALDDFIVATASRLEVTDGEGVAVVLMLDDQRQFEEHFPLARTLRDGWPYPIRVHRVAAARRAHILESAGRPARIAVVDQ